MAKWQGCCNYLTDFKTIIIKMLQQIKTNTFETKGKKEKCNKDRKYNKESNDVFGTKRYITEFIFFFKVPEGARYN